jgi:hypothetical protein
MIVETYAGLCNRLRVILSYRAKYGPIEVIWPRDPEIAGGHFLDVLEPLEGVTFRDSGPADVRTLDALGGGWEEAWRELRPVAGDRLDVLELVRFLRPYAAVHVRRTDNTAYAQREGVYTDDATFAAWIRACRSESVYVATDNLDTQIALERVVNESGKVPRMWEPIAGHDAQRHTTLAHAVADLFLCAGAAEFRGSGGSSFSHTIATMRRIGGWWT